MRKTYLDNIRFITVILVVIYHVIYIFNSVTVHGIIGPFSENQPQDVYQYIVYPWFMLLLFVVSGMSARFELCKKTEKEFVRARTRKLLVPSTIGLLVFFWILGYYNMLISGAFDSIGSVPGPVLFLIMAVSGSGPLWYIQMLWLFSILLIAAMLFCAAPYTVTAAENAGDDPLEAQILATFTSDFGRRCYRNFEKKLK